jgi:hypothetical protein
MSEQLHPRSIIELGLRPGAMIPNHMRALKNSQWYDQYAHRVSGGDIGIGQAEEAAERMENGELLAILPSFAISMRRPSRLDQRLNNNVDDPGMRFVSKNFALLILPRCIYLGPNAGRVENNDFYTPQETLSPAHARRFMRIAQEQAPCPDVFSLHR